MFAWICPKCGKEIPPQYDGCPEWCPEYDKQKAYLKNTPPPIAEATSPVIKNLVNLDKPNEGGAMYGAPPPPAPVEPPGPRILPAGAAVAYETDVPEYKPQQSSVPAQVAADTALNGAPRREMNPFVVTLLAAVVFAALGYAGFTFYERSKGNSPELSFGKSEEAMPTGTHRLNRIVSVSGLRFVPGKNKQMQARFLVVNSSGAPTPTFSGTVYVRPKDAEADADALLSFDLNDVELGAYDAREMQAPIKTTLKSYELPDAALVRADLAITKPAE